MLSIYNIKDAKGAKHYYEKEESYYVQGTSSTAGGSFYIGKGAEILGLKGEVDTERFSEFLEGRPTSDIQLGRTQDGKTVHRAGYDLTFAASKSASLLAFLPGGDPTITELNKACVEAVADYIQKNASQTRIMSNGKVEKFTTDNILAAAFPHATSRAMDPHMHIHLVLMNMVQLEEGKWRSLSSEKIYELKMLLGTIYRTELARQLQERGYKIIQTSHDGLFEIQGNAREQIDSFSTRHNDIVQNMQANGLNSYIDSKHSMDVTRAKYRNLEELTPEEIRQSWALSAKEAGLDVAQLSMEAKERGDIHKPASNEEVGQAVEYAINLLSERKSAFTTYEVLRWALAKNIGQVSLAQAETQIEQYLQQSRLLKTKIPHMVTTPEIVALEEQNLSRMLAFKTTLTPICSKNEVKALIANKKLTQSQQQAIQFILTTKDAIIGVQGFAGTGKTTMQRYVLDALKAHGDGFNVIGLAPSGKAAMMLQASLDVACQTVDSFIIDANKGAIKDDKPCYIVLDEASMLSSHNAKKLLDVFETLPQGSRLVLQGDYQQLQSVTAGNPYLQWLAKGMNHVQMFDIVRQDSVNLKEAVLHAILKDVDSVMRRLEGRLHEIPDNEQRLKAMADDYLSRSPYLREKTLLMTTSNEDRRELNKLVRDGLKIEGVIESEGISTKILVSKNLEQAQSSNIYAYEIDDVVRLGRAQAGLLANQYYKVVGLDPATKAIELKGSDAFTINITPGEMLHPEAIELYRQEERELCAGDTIRWRRTTNKEAGLINAQTMQVEAVNGDYATLKTQDNTRLTLNMREQKNQHFDYAKVGTAHGLQGDTQFDVIGHMHSHQSALSSLHALYVILSRASNETRLYVDDVEALSRAIDNFKQEKITALEALKGEDYAAKLFEPIKKHIEQLDGFEKKEPLKAQAAPQKQNRSPNKAVSPSESYTNWDKEAVIKALNSDNVLRLIKDKGLVDLQARPFKYRQGDAIRLGKSGSLCITGHSIIDWSGRITAKNIFQLYADEKGVGYSQAINEIGQWLNLAPILDNEPFEQIKVAPQPALANTPNQEDIQKIAKAREYYDKSIPVQGTLGERYLRQHRGITAQTLPDSVRFLPERFSGMTQTKHSALLSVAKDAQGNVQAVQATLLDNDGGRLKCRVLEAQDKSGKIKQTYVALTDKSAEKLQPGKAEPAPIEKHVRPLTGRLKFGALNTINEASDPSLPILICEGLETGLSIRDAMPDHKVIVTHGVRNFKRIEAPKGTPVLILVDNDGPNSPTEEIAKEAVSQLKQKGLKAAYAKPETEGADYNDLARRDGLEAVRKSIQKNIQLNLRIKMQGPELGF